MKTKPDTLASIRRDIAEGAAVCRYIKTEEAWYSKTTMAVADPGVVKEWCIGVDALRDGRPDGTYGEFMILWYDLASNGLTMRLGIFSDAFLAARAANIIEPLLELPADATPEQVLAVLDRHGFVDATDRKGPHAI